MKSNNNFINETLLKENNNSSASDFFQLLKPRVMSLAIFTAICGIILSPNKVNYFIAFVSVVCIAIGAGAAGTLNMWYEADLDSLMHRTKNRPLPSKKINRDEALSYGIVLGSFSIILLYLTSNLLSSILLTASILFYVFIYTIWLKKRTYQNIVIGGIAGSIPPIIGWSVVENDISLFPILLFLIIFFWTPPHFWALSLFCNADYKRANIPMLPLVKGIPATKNNILVYSIILSFVSILPFYYKFAHSLYLIIALILNSIFIIYTLLLFKSDNYAKPLFKYSILYLFLIFLSLILDKYLS